MRVNVRSLVLLAFGISACSDSLPFDPRSAERVIPSADAVNGLGTVVDLRARRDAWLASGPHDYVVEEQFSCFCGYELELQPSVLEVRNRRVTRVWNLRIGRRFVPQEGTLLSVEQLFARAIEYAEHGERVVVKYDAALGYPVHLILGEPERDAGVTYVLSSLRPL
jgi:hypothetical protein